MRKALVASLRSLPPASAPAGEVRSPLVVKALHAIGVVKDDPESIDHARPPAGPVEEGVTVAHGAYVGTSASVVMASVGRAVPSRGTAPRAFGMIP